ncbi:MAG: exodeoxyribonuclease III [Patescibacteria group bacterium]|jgi:exodeoxyribonuclease-3
MKIISWNVNGIRAVIKKGFVKFLQTEKPDVLCLQEIKISDSARNQEVFDFSGYQEFWHSAERPGYSGTMMLVKDGVKVFGEEKFPDDSEGRVQVLEFSKFYLVNVYFPNSNHELLRLDFKLKFNNRLQKFLKKLEEVKPIIICGDFNVAHEPIDLFHPKENEGSAGYTLEERTWMTKFLKAGFVDTFREMYPKKVQYSWWSYRMGARQRNIGWRIDYFCVSAKIVTNISRSFIMNQIFGSDHCPVGIELKK